MILKKLAKGILTVLSLVVLANVSLAQTKTVTGKVTDSKGDPVPSATVTARGTNISTTTAGDGTFRISVPAGVSALTITSVGFKEQVVNIEGKESVAVSLETANAALDEVVVIGYGTSRKKDLTGAVSKLSTANFNQGAITNAAEALQGKLAGVAVTPAGGDPNASATIRIRGIGSIQGDASPLIVVDGVQGIDLNTIPPNEIESFDILKDASATAIYGSRGANGVVLVTTKKGRSGQTRVEYSTFVATEKVANTVDLMSAADVRTYFKANNPLLDGGASTNWIDAISRTGLSHSHSVAVSGGTDKFNYRGALTYFDRQGVLLNSGRRNINARLAIQQKALNNKLDIQLNVIYNVSNRRYIDYGSSTVNATISGVGQESLNPFLFAYSMNPTNPVYSNSATNPYGGYYQPNQYASQNPVAFLEQIYNRGRENNVNTSARVEYSLTKTLKAFVFGSYNTINGVNDFFSPTTAYNTPLGFAKKGNENSLNLLGNYGLIYRKAFGKHSFDATAVYEYFQNTKDEFSVAVQDIKYNSLLDNNLAAGGQVVQGFPKSYKEQYAIISYLGRVNYNYNGKYYFTASLRRDGSSKLGTKNYWGNFPSVSAAWAVSKENFMESAKWLNDLKVRVGYGITGNQNGISPLNAQKLIGFGDPTLVNGVVVTPIVAKQNANTNLKWEKKKQFNAGLDFSILGNKLSGTIDFYAGKTNDLLYKTSVNDASKFEVVGDLYINAGELTNKGVEISLSSPVVKRNDFLLIVSGNISFNTNKVVNLNGEASDKNGKIISISPPNRVNWGSIYGRGLSFSNVTFLEVGYPIGTILVPHYTGKNAAGEPQIKSSIQDSFYRFSPLPKFIYGFSIAPKYKNFDAVINFRGVSGNKIYNGTLTNLNNEGRLADGDNVYSGAVKDGFKKPQISDYFIESGSFLRLDNLSVGYNFSLSPKSAFKSLRAYVAGNNLFIITNYKGTDPEVPADGTGVGIENINIYPKNRAFTLGINIGF